ncbi:MAG: ATPase, T2SS/T4P/T4SS family, partial [Promethearchaeota archaeon]
KIRNQKCHYKEFECKISSKFPNQYQIKDSEYLDPILVYNIIKARLSNRRKKEIIDPICINCQDFIERSENSILQILDNLKIIQKFKNFKNNNDFCFKKNDFYRYIFLGNNLATENSQEVQNISLNKNKKLLTAYKTGKYSIYTVGVYKIPYENEKRYIVRLFYKEKREQDYFENIIQDIFQNIELMELDQIYPLETLINMYKKEALRIINLKYKFSIDIKKKIAFITTIRKLNLDKLFPLLIDDFVEEIFLDSPKDEIYINHQNFGRCRTDIKLNSKQIERVKTLFRLYSGKRLDFTNPTIKFVIKNKFFYCRFAIDIEPVQINNFALDIRKLNKNVLTIQDLLKKRTIDPLIAAFLYFSILRKKNITVTGETDTGKTTLINALDLLTPKEFRKIYVEDVTESLNQYEYCKHQLKYMVDPSEESLIDGYSKSNQIKTLLHRTPDLIYLGEILTKEEAEALFHCLAAGLRGFQTIHSKNIESLINRFIYHFGINHSCLNDLDLIILMKKIFNERKVVGIFEISKAQNTKNKQFNSIFEFNPETQKWLLTQPLSETNIIFDLKKYEDLTDENFLRFIEIYKEIFEFHLKIKEIHNHELIDFFHKVSYYSLRSVDKLTQFWNKWKKNRSLNF